MAVTYGASQGDPGFVPHGKPQPKRSIPVLDMHLERAAHRRRDELDPFARTVDVDRQVIDRLLDERLAAAK